MIMHAAPSAYQLYRRGEIVLDAVVRASQNTAMSFAFSKSFVSGRAWSVGATVAALVSGLSVANAQSLRITDGGSEEPPSWATFRLGPFHSAGQVSQSIGARWTEGSGQETDFLSGTSRGEILADGWDVPLISMLSIRNYAQLSRHIDLQLTVLAQYEYYPLGTQSDQFLFNLGDEGISGRIDSEFRVTRNLHGVVYWEPRYQTDYVDARGDLDRLGGTEFEYFESIVGMTLTWEFLRDKSIAGTMERTDFLPQERGFDNQEYVEHSARTRYTQQLLEGIEAGVELEHRDIDHKVASRRDSTIDTVNLFASGGFADEGLLRLSRNSTLSGSIGYSRAETEALVTDEADGRSGSSTESLVWSVEFDWGEAGQLSKNMRHGLGYQRQIDNRFDADIAIVDTFSYYWTWLVGLWDFNFESDYELVDTQGSDVTDYTDWSNSLGVLYHLTKYWALDASSTYTIRDNEAVTGVGRVSDDDVDYEEWVSRIGTGYQLTRSIDFLTYVEHANRDSDGDSLDFARDTFEAVLTYTRVF